MRIISWTKVLFLNNLSGITLSKLNMDREAIYSFDQAIKINP